MHVAAPVRLLPCHVWLGMPAAPTSGCLLLKVPAPAAIASRSRACCPHVLPSAGLRGAWCPT